MNPTRAWLPAAAGSPGRPRATPGRQADGPALQGDDVTVLLVVDLAAASTWWGWSRLVRGPGAFAGVPGLRFAKVLGSGHEGRFGLRPSATVRGLFAVFDGERRARAFVDADARVEAWRGRAREQALFMLRAWSSRGRWSGHSIAAGASVPPEGTRVAALTRASIHPLRAPAFWRHAPAAQRSLESAEGCRFAVGLGEAPLLRQATFSLWNDVASMDAYARHGAHQQAIAAAARGRFFTESMFVRFAVIQAEGAWMGEPVDG